MISLNRFSVEKSGPDHSRKTFSSNIEKIPAWLVSEKDSELVRFSPGS